jgi:hypothetical protein
MRQDKTRYELQQLAFHFAISQKLGPMVVIHFAHDDWCRMLKGDDVCDCKPTMQVNEIPETDDGTEAALKQGSASAEATEPTYSADSAGRVRQS